MMISDQDKIHLRRCVELASEALEAGDAPFGSVLVDSDGQVLQEDRNRINSVDATYHPEIALARWAARNMSETARATATVYTSGEHCAMCSAAHGLAGLGRIVYISSAKQLGEWMADMGVESPLSINTLSITEIAPDIAIEGPVAGLDDEIKSLQQRFVKQG
ncbi:nucleoside deaminase [Psychrobacter sp. T6-1]|uniref:nucleoside deaminase n=1 Tax=Psychrobacter sp. T6-1 TaxID=3457447 RepID=UPI003FD50788